jgi:uncharacterized protein
MKIVLDTYVFFSGVLFTASPHKILKAWRAGRVVILLSSEILEEYQRVGNELTTQFRDVDLKPSLELLTAHGEMVYSPSILPRIKEDPSDNKFLACALAGKAKFIVSKDRHLLKLREFQGIRISGPRNFSQVYLKGR